MTERAYLTIGEVLKRLRGDFPDISISKIRFLENEGLVEPERTPSGYRKFYPGHIDRLKYVLTLQRDHFMPLKVIKKRMDQTVEHLPPPLAQTGVNGAATDTPRPPPPDEEIEISLEGGLQLTPDEFLGASGLERAEAEELEEFGLIRPQSLPTGEPFFDEEALAVARLAKDFGKFGIGARHLKMYKNFAEKEAGLFDQVLMPSARQSGGEGSYSELSKLSRKLKHALLQSTLRERR